MASIDELNRRFGVKGVARFVAGEGGLAALEVGTEVCSGRVYLLGAHVVDWRPRGEREGVLFMSKKSAFKVGSPIRGGVPVCLPWFGPHGTEKDAPGHGFVRTAEWEVESVEVDGKGEVSVTLGFESKGHKYFAAPFAVKHRMVFGRTLRMALEVRNTGATAATFGEALHSYFAVGDIRQVTVKGLEGTEFLDKMRSRTATENEAIRITEEIDRVYLNTAADVVIEDAAWGRRIRVSKKGSAVTVVWNPWTTKVMPDFDPAEHAKMMCVETANTHQYSVMLGARGTHVMEAEIGVER